MALPPFFMGMRCGLFPAEAGLLLVQIPEPLDDAEEHPHAADDIQEERQIKKICETCPFWKICRVGCKIQNRTYLTEEWCGHREFLMEAYPTLFRIAQTL